MKPDHHRAADLLARGWSYDEVGRELGVPRSTVNFWVGQPDFKRLREAARRRQLAEEPTAESVLQSALHATMRSGHRTGAPG